MTFVQFNFSSLHALNFTKIQIPYDKYKNKYSSVKHLLESKAFQVIISIKSCEQLASCLAKSHLKL